MGPSVTTLFLDLETFCDVPINCGTHAYAERVEITVMAFAVDDNDVHVVDLTAPGMPAHWPDMLQKTVAAADRIVIHNSAFDHTVLRHAWGLDLPVEKIDDTMVMALSHSLPGSLGKLCDIFRVPVDQAKDKEGKSLIQLFCKPRPKKQKLRRATRDSHPAEWAKFLDYARLDIEAMRAVYRKLPRWNFERESNMLRERDLWHLDQAINERGVAVDVDLARAAVTAVEREKGELAEQAQELTYGTVASATKREQLLHFILAAHGIELPDLKAATLEKLLEDDIPPGLRELLLVRLQASTASVAKYKGLLKAVSSDGRLRGTLQFCGANRTGRWAGRLFQPQNLPRPAIGDLRDEALQEAIGQGIEAIKAGTVDLVTDNVMEVASAAVRGLIVAPDGKKLVVADLSNIEGRVLAWLAGEVWKLKAFADYDAGRGHDLYKLPAGRILGKPPEQITKGERQEVGKVSELALGYEGGVGAFIAFADAYSLDIDELGAKARPALHPSILGEARAAWDWTRSKKRTTYGLSEETWVSIEAIKRSWRKAHPAITAFWSDLADGVRRVITGSASFVQVGPLQLRKSGAWLRIILPSGRSLCYPSPQVSEAGEISYMGVNQFNRKWTRIKTYGGKLAENVTQAVARDVLAHGMLLAEPAGYEIVLGVHDELLTETPDTSDFTHEGLAALMSTNPPWAEGLPLAASGFEAKRYRKDG